MGKYTIINKDEAAEILQIFQAKTAIEPGPVTDTQELKGGIINSVYTIKAEKARYVLRIVNPSANKNIAEGLQTVHQFQKRCHEQGLGFVPEVIGEIEDWKNRKIQLMKFVPGKMVHEASAGQAYNLGKAVAEFHEKAGIAAQGLKLDQFNPVMTTAEQMGKSLLRMEKNEPAEEFNYMVSLVNTTASFARLGLKMRGKNIKQGVIHGDLHPANVIFAEDSESVNGIVDYDVIKKAPLVFDIGKTIFKFGIQKVADNPRYEMKLEVVEAIIKGYNSVRKLSADEVGLLRDVVFMIRDVSTASTQKVILIGNRQASDQIGVDEKRKAFERGRHGFCRLISKLSAEMAATRQ